MVEAIMYVIIGFLLGWLLALPVIPLVHRRAVRLTLRQLESSLPMSMAEFQADKDQLRAEFAMSTRRLEMSTQQLKDKTVSLLVRLSQKDDAISRLKTDRYALKTEVMDLKMQIGAFQKQLTGVNNRTDARLHVVRQMSPRRMFH
jgi:septal ring factor EnvC (AmiA/AmiB activator)